MIDSFVKDYDVCPCWISPCNPDEHKGGCQDYDMGECRIPCIKGEWILCEHLAKECNNRCDNIYCEKHKDYEKFKNCFIKGCNNEVTAVIDNTPLCDIHYEEHIKLRKQIELQFQKEQQEYKKKYTSLNIIEQWVGYYQSEIEDSNSRCKHVIGYTIDAEDIAKLICDIRKDIDEVVKRGLKEGWLK